MIKPWDEIPVTYHWIGVSGYGNARAFVDRPARGEMCWFNIDYFGAPEPIDVGFMESHVCGKMYLLERPE